MNSAVSPNFNPFLETVRRFWQNHLYVLEGLNVCRQRLSRELVIVVKMVAK